MHKEVLNKSQIELLPLVKQFKREFYLVGGTAIALHIGHRRSIDFDLFKANRLVLNRIINKISAYNSAYNITRRVEEQLNLTIDNVKFTFFEYPYPIEANHKFEDIIKLPDLLSLAAMKAFALGRRSKWKDYVDLYFIIKDHYSVKQIVALCDNIYGQLFSEKLFRAQLCYFEDIDYSEEVEYLVKQPPDNKIKEFLTKTAVDVRL
ncbi:MAG: nucleotidyl transferase AbiEii/AbiGii toxin family protein [Bacteroidetes bacterium]|nr:nucleotidyl transferase AbiEii/AbiGii toxin family protein [Bacteroidota bacterium]